MNTFTNLNEAPTRELTSDELALLVLKGPVLVTTDEGDEVKEDVTSPTLH